MRAGTFWTIFRVIRSALGARSLVRTAGYSLSSGADSGEWVLPGGIVELDEDPRETVRREVLEETGVTVEPGQLRRLQEHAPWRCVSGPPLPSPVGRRAAN